MKHPVTDIILRWRDETHTLKKPEYNGEREREEHF